MAVYERELPDRLMSVTAPIVLVTSVWECRGPDGCFKAERAVLYQSECGCWVFKCLLCGNVDWVRCSEDEDHWEDFEDQAQSFD